MFAAIPSISRSKLSHQAKIPNGDAAQRQFETYQRLYGRAPELSDAFDIPSRDAFDYCRRMGHFVLIVPYYGRRPDFGREDFHARRNILVTLGRLPTAR